MSHIIEYKHSNTIVKQQSIAFTYIENDIYELFYSFTYAGTIADPGFYSILLNSLNDNSFFYIRLVDLTDNVIMIESTFSNHVVKDVRKVLNLEDGQSITEDWINQNTPLLEVGIGGGLRRTW